MSYLNGIWTPIWFDNPNLLWQTSDGHPDDNCSIGPTHEQERVLRRHFLVLRDFRVANGHCLYPIAGCASSRWLSKFRNKFWKRSRNIYKEWAEDLMKLGVQFSKGDRKEGKREIIESLPTRKPCSKEHYNRHYRLAERVGEWRRRQDAETDDKKSAIQDVGVKRTTADKPLPALPLPACDLMAGRQDSYFSPSLMYHVNPLRKLGPATKSEVTSAHHSGLLMCQT